MSVEILLKKFGWLDGGYYTKCDNCGKYSITSEDSKTCYECATNKLYTDYTAKEAECKELTKIGVQQFKAYNFALDELSKKLEKLTAINKTLLDACEKSVNHFDQIFDKSETLSELKSAIQEARKVLNENNY